MVALPVKVTGLPHIAEMIGVSSVTSLETSIVTAEPDAPWTLLPMSLHLRSMSLHNQLPAAASIRGSTVVHGC